MVIVRSILAIVVGMAVGVLVIVAIHIVNFIVYGPYADQPFADRMESMQKMQKDPAAMKKYADEMPTNALILVVLSWQAGAFLGGCVAGLIAAQWRVWHAGAIGALVLAATIYTIYDMKNKFDVSHPDSVIIAGLLLPLPLSLLAGKFASWMRPPSPPAAVDNP